MVTNLRQDAAVKLARTLIALVEAASVERSPRQRGEAGGLATLPHGPRRLRAQTAHAIFLVATTRFYGDSDVKTLCGNESIRSLLFGGDPGDVGGDTEAARIHKLGLFSLKAVSGTFMRCQKRGLTPNCVAATARIGSLGIPVRAS